MSLNKIAENIAYKLGDQFNLTLRESIKNTLISYRAKYIRDDAGKGNGLATDFFQTLVLDLKEVNKLEDVEANINCITSGGNCYAVVGQRKFKLLKSVKQLPNFIRLKSFGASPFRYIGSVDRLERFKYSEPSELEFKLELPYQKPNQVYYFIVNNYLYLLNNLEICNVLIEGVFADPREAYKLCDDEVFIDDRPFPIAEDMLMSISKSIVDGEYPRLVQTGETINIQQNDKGKNNV